MGNQWLELDKPVVSEDPETANYVLNHTMLRIKDPRVSIEFYTSVLGMTLFKQLDFSTMEFSLYFLGYIPSGVDGLPQDPNARTTATFAATGLIELTHNWSDNSSDADEPPLGANSRGFGHIGISVPDVYAACERLDRLGVNFTKRPDEGKMAGIAFIQDPDGHSIEILQAQLSSDLCEKFGALRPE